MSLEDIITADEAAVIATIWDAADDPHITRRLFRSELVERAHAKPAMKTAMLRIFDDRRQFLREQGDK